MTNYSIGKKIHFIIANKAPHIKKVLIKSDMQIAQTDFSFNCMKTTQEYLMYFKEFSCNM